MFRQVMSVSLNTSLLYDEDGDPLPIPQINNRALTHYLMSGLTSESSGVRFWVLQTQTRQ